MQRTHVGSPSPCARPAFAPGSTVSDAMIIRPKVLGPETTVDQVRAFFHDDHVHAALIVDGEHLVAVVERSDLAHSDPECIAGTLGRLNDRVVGPHTDLAAAWEHMTGSGRRRLGVIDDHGACVGLLCLKRSGTGFCSDDDVTARSR